MTEYDDKLEAKRSLILAGVILISIIAQFVTIFKRRLGNIFLVSSYIGFNLIYLVFFIFFESAQKNEEEITTCTYKLSKFSQDYRVY